MSWGGGSKRAWKLRSSLAKGIIVQNTDMIRQFYPDLKNIELISRGVNTEKFAPHTPDSSLLEKMQTSAGERIIICVANFVPVKGIEILLQAFESLTQEFPQWKLWLVGDDAGEYGDSLKAWVKSHDMESKVKFSGKQGEIRPYLDHAEIFVLPTLDEGRREGSPVAMLEAMSNGKVVLGSAVPGIKDQLIFRKDHLFKAGDSKELMEKLRAFMITSTADNKKSGASFIDHVKSYFSIEKEIHLHENFYLKILGN